MIATFDVGIDVGTSSFRDGGSDCCIGLGARRRNTIATEIRPTSRRQPSTPPTIPPISAALFGAGPRAAPIDEVGGTTVESRSVAVDALVEVSGLAIVKDVVAVAVMAVVAAVDELI